MYDALKRSTVIVLLLFMVAKSEAGSPWGADYFPNTTLITEEGKKVKFFDDLIKDKVVAINFIYTTCADSCPLETAHLVKVQKLMGDRLGKDVFFYSISIDPEHDTAPVLKEYKERFKAKWTFLTGDKDEINHLRKKLGLYIDEIDDGSNNHNISMIIGNQRTGRWMKRSPFENPHVLADQIGHWLTDWKTAKKGNDYSQAPQLRDFLPGEELFRTRCAACHEMTGDMNNEGIGPDLLGVHLRRERKWLVRWLKEPDKMLEEKDPLAVALFNQYNQVTMPNMRLNRKEVFDLLSFFEAEYNRQKGLPLQGSSLSEKQSGAVDVIGAWIREAHPGAKANAGYMSLINLSDETETIVKVESEDFESVEFHEMSMEDGMMKMRKLNDLVIDPGKSVNFEPGGKHLMLNNPVAALAAGSTVNLMFTFSSGERQEISVPVLN